MIWYGTITFAQPDAKTWIPVIVDDGVFSDPIIIVGPLSNNDPTPATVRIQNVRRND